MRYSVYLCINTPCGHQMWATLFAVNPIDRNHVRTVNYRPTFGIAYISFVQCCSVFRLHHPSQWMLIGETMLWKIYAHIFVNSGAFLGHVWAETTIITIASYVKLQSLHWQSAAVICILIWAVSKLGAGPHPGFSVGLLYTNEGITS